MAIIQARMGSTRLPGKVLMDIGGKTMLERVVGRVSRAVGRVIVATTGWPKDDMIEDLADKRGWDLYRGPENNVARRYFEAASVYGAETILRITADCPLIDPGVIRKVVEAFDGQDYVSNIIRRTYPRGLDAEVFTLSALIECLNWADRFEREHVTKYILNNLDGFETVSVENDTNLSHLQWSVDVAEDLEFARKVYGNLGEDFTWKDILAMSQ